MFKVMTIEEAERAGNKIRVLVVEDSADDAELMLRELRRSGFDPVWDRITTEAEFEHCFRAEYDLILADYTMPQFNGMRALELLKQSERKIPFIIVSGTIGEELAVATIKMGATDYLLKDRLARLGTSVIQALEQFRMRREHEASEKNRQAQVEAERASAAKSEFLSRMSHELRTPLNAILGFGQLLELEDLTTAQHSSVAHIVEGGRHLLRLINEVLDISAVEGGHMTIALELLDPYKSVEESFALIRALAKDRSIQLRLLPFQDESWSGKGWPLIRADPYRLKQVLLNLLSNAIKYNIVGGLVTVSCQLRDQALRVRVADTGHGIPSAKMRRVFTPFDRLDAQASGVEGTGLGLALSKRLMEAMGGDLGLETTETVAFERGATFWLELPLTAPVVTRESVMMPASIDQRAASMLV